VNFTIEILLSYVTTIILVVIILCVFLEFGSFIIEILCVFYVNLKNLKSFHE